MMWQPCLRKMKENKFGLEEISMARKDELSKMNGKRDFIFRDLSFWGRTIGKVTFQVRYFFIIIRKRLFDGSIR